MYLKVFSILAVVQVVFSQGITFQDGQLGVNFGGYNAGVGFGPGGLSASAGTPNGQRAEAGLGGTVNGNTAGGLYAGATAGKGIDASASLSGDVNNGFGLGQAQASAGGVSKSVVKTVSTNVETEVDSTQYQIPIAMQSVVTQAPVVVVPQVDQVESQLDTNVDVEAPYPSRTVPISVSETTVGPVQYLPPNTAAVAPVPSSSQTAHGSGSSVSTSTFDADDNDLTHNTVPQTTNVLVQKPKPVDQQVVVQQTVPKVVNVQKIKVRRPRPSTYTVYQKQFQIPKFVSKTVQYPVPVYQQQQAAPVQITQLPIPVYKPIVYQKRIHINTVPQVAVEQRFEEVESSQGPTTTTTSTTPRPIYQYTYDKNKVINEIFSIPYHILNSVNNLINAKLAGGYQVQKTITYN